MQGVETEWNLSTIQIGLLGSINQAGILVGSMLWGYISDKYGRSPAFKNTAIFGTISSFCLTTAYNYEITLISLFIIGICIGGELLLAAAVFHEYCPPSKRYHLTMLSIFFSLGSFSISLIAWIVSITNNTGIYDWRIIVGSGFILEFLVLLFRFSLQETPAYSMSKGDIISTEKVLNEISLKNAGKGFKFINLDTNLINHYEFCDTDIEESNKTATKKYLIKELFTKKLLKITIEFSFLITNQAFFCTAYSYSGIVNYMPEYLSGLSTSEVYFNILIQQSTGIPVVFLAAWLVETRLGWKYTTALSYIIRNILLFILYW